MRKKRSLRARRPSPRTKSSRTAGVRRARVSAAPRPIVDELLRHLVHEMPDRAMFLMDPQGTILSWNKGVRQYFGYPKNEFVGMKFERLFLHENRRDAQPARVLAVAKKVGKSMLEQNFRRKNGKPVVASGTVSAIRDGKTLRGYAVILLSGLTEYIAQELRQSERQYRNLAEAIPQIVWTARPDGYQDFFNGRWFEYTGFTEKETYALQGKKTALHPDDYRLYLRCWTKARKEGKRYEAEYRFRRHDGTYRWHLVRGIPVRNDEGKIVKWFGTFTDIHDKKIAEDMMRSLSRELEEKVQIRTEELRTARENDRVNLQRLKNMIEHMSIGALAVDEKDTVLEVNEIFCGLFGIDFSRSRFVGKSVHHLADGLRHSLHGDAYPNQLLLLLKRRQAGLSEEISLPNGRIVLQDFLPVFDDDAYRGAFFLYRDVTQERRTDLAKSEFMSLASHQLRTPLTAIRWTLGRLTRRLEHVIQEEDARLLEQGRVSAMRMSETITAMLQISRIESGRVQLRNEAIDLSPFLGRTLGVFADAVQQRDLSVKIRCDADIKMYTDPQFLQELITNLLSNSIKYSPPGTAIELRAAVWKRDRVRIEIQDHGFGIPADEQKKVFSKFFRAANVVQHDTEGTGLGLYLVSLIAGVLGGEISFVSREGEGTTFTLTLPQRRFPAGA